MALQLNHIIQSVVSWALAHHREPYLNICLASCALQALPPLLSSPPPPGILVRERVMKNKVEGGGGRAESMPMPTYVHTHTHTQHHTATRLKARRAPRHTRSLCLLFGSLLTWNLCEPRALPRYAPPPIPGPHPRVFPPSLNRDRYAIHSLRADKWEHYVEGKHTSALALARVDTDRHAHTHMLYHRF